LDPQQKGLDLLIKAFAKINDRNDSILILAGPDWRDNKNYLKRIVKTLKIESSVIFTGAVFGEDKWALLKLSDFFVHPSRWEAGVPFSVLEALAMKKPCLLTEAASPERIVERYGAGKVVLNNVDDIKNGLLFLLNLKNTTYVKMSQNAKDLVKSEFDWKVIAQKIIDAYNKTLNTH
jgi:glycosyltransferase involved in cell wall biosynthesis